MTDLVAWLRQQLDEDERVALRARQTPRTDWQVTQKSGTLTIDTDVESQGWKFGGGSGMWQCDDSEDDCDRYRSWAWAESAHIARHDPARVLAEVEAKRAILELHDGEHDCRELITGVYPHDWPSAASWGSAGEAWRHASSDHFEGPCPTLRLLAEPYAGRPGWREEWAT
jgi:hypothetical protein